MRTGSTLVARQTFHEPALNQKGKYPSSYAMPEPKLIAHIFARGGSKGLPGKNLRLLDGKPLLAHAIQRAKASQHIGRVIVSTDDDQIAQAATEWGAEVPYMRPAALAEDSSPELEAWRHAIVMISKHSLGDTSTFISVPATAPFGAPEDVDACIELFQKGNADLVLTAAESTRNPYFNMLKKDELGYASTAIKPEKVIHRRQDAPKTYDIATIAYVSDPQYVLNTHSLLDGRVKIHTVPPVRALDIDTEFDLLIAQGIMQQGHPDLRLQSA